jgi:hypothetical protein
VTGENAMPDVVPAFGLVKVQVIVMGSFHGLWLSFVFIVAGFVYLPDKCVMGHCPIPHSLFAKREAKTLMKEA